MIRPGSLPGDAAGQAMAPPAETMPQDAGSSPVSSRTNRTAIAALVSSVVCLFGLGSIIGIGLGVYALNQVAVTGENGRGLAVGGILVGAVTLLLSMIGIMMKLSAP
ncbi:hypothetical protein TUM20985_13830 [Mycobacterium antarcticum]|uniref:DUF4190 domain-containing protein n=1 Tax=Mycolicibacterium sp. TUM20985 TaxID=3023370 RepID=UPI002573ED99|nr:DUF4190 domain-containing protein [Mycolicibacterium sp. TUM20985]BDX30836.1 hypothetical protein TUM20985_13830 [Mycolicibacterium sp. TUM20985]